MSGLSFRAQQWIVSAVGALFIIPTSLFFGGMFSFAFGTQQSLGAWLFGLTAFWFQILGILASFFKPRLAAAWMLLSLGLSLFICAATEWRWEHHAGRPVSGLSEWLRDGPGYLKTTWFFWIAPLFVALLLLRPAPPAGDAD